VPMHPLAWRGMGMRWLSPRYRLVNGRLVLTHQRDPFGPDNGDISLRFHLNLAIFAGTGPFGMKGRARVAVRGGQRRSSDYAD